MDVLLEGMIIDVSERKKGFNPYCNGCTSRRTLNNNNMAKYKIVSILIVMDVLLEEKIVCLKTYEWLLVSILIVMDVLLEGCLF